MAEIESAHPELQLGTGEWSDPSTLTKTQYHASSEIQDEFRLKRLADTVSEEHFPRHSSPTALAGYASTNLSALYDIDRGVSSFCFVDARSATLDWSHLPPLTREHPTHWDYLWPYGQQLGTELLCLLHRDRDASRRLASAPQFGAALAAELIRSRPLKDRFQRALRTILEFRLVQAIGGETVVHMDPDGPLGIPNIRLAIPELLRARVILRDGLTCRVCGSIVEDDTFDIDHILPVADGGINVLENLRVTHRRCNRGRPRSTRRLRAKQRLSEVQP